MNAVDVASSFTNQLKKYIFLFYDLPKSFHLSWACSLPPVNWPFFFLLSTGQYFFPSAPFGPHPISSGPVICHLLTAAATVCSVSATGLPITTVRLGPFPATAWCATGQTCSTDSQPKTRRGARKMVPRRSEGRKASHWS